MHAIQGGWAGQVFALATSNDSAVGKKSRIRRSKEERKTMVESFIKKYQKSNNGNFPSLNLTHKEVGGSFYTVREIVREIIQENRVLAPPKESLEEHGHSGFLEQHPLGSISIEPQFDLSGPERIHMATHIMPGNYQIANEESISSNHYQDTSGKEVNGVEVLEEATHINKSVISKVDLEDKDDGTIQSSQEFSGLQNKDDQTVDKTEEFGQRIYGDSAVMEILDRENCEAQDVEASQDLKESHMKSNVVVETFPLRPVPKTIHDMDGESGKLQEAAGTLGGKAILQYEESSAGLVDDREEGKLPDSTEELNSTCGGDKVVPNLEGSSLESSTNSSASKPVADLVPKVSTPDGTKASSSAESLTYEESTAVGIKSSKQDKSSFPNVNNAVLDRINLETWDGTSKKKSARPESNPLLALVWLLGSFIAVCFVALMELVRMEFPGQRADMNRRVVKKYSDSTILQERFVDKFMAKYTVL